jgi:chaperonin GroEL
MPQATLGEKIIASACYAPLLKILDNAGDGLNEDMFTLLIKHKDLTYDVKKMEVVDAYKTGILDPVKVTRIALENALSVASTILTSESVVFEEKTKDSQDPMMGMDF